MSYVRTEAHRRAIAEKNREIKRKYPQGFDSKSRLYRIWKAMHFRCYQPSHEAYERYHGRGIGICDEWRTDYSAFLRWALANGYADDLTIDRRNNNLGYSPGNCRWIPAAEQNLNRRDNRPPLTIFGETKFATEWARDPRCVVRPGVLQSRLSIGWDPEAAITTPEADPKKPVFITAFGEAKRLPAWVADPRCQVTLYTLYGRIAKGWDGERAITTPTPKRAEDDTHCAHGHELSGDNLYVEPSGRRRCRVCMRAVERRRIRRRK